VAENSENANISAVLTKLNPRRSIFGSQKRKQSEVVHNNVETRSAKRVNTQKVRQAFGGKPASVPPLFYCFKVLRALIP
jgi:hypothetical protein